MHLGKLAKTIEELLRRCLAPALELFTGFRWGPRESPSAQVPNYSNQKQPEHLDPIQERDPNLQLVPTDPDAVPEKNDIGEPQNLDRKDQELVIEKTRRLIVPPWVDMRAINIGLDFGTYSTKVMVSIRGEKKAKVLFLDEPTPGYPRFVVPSLVGLNAGQLFFGRDALQMGGPMLFRSLKVSLLPPSTRTGWNSVEFPPGTTPDLLVALYLSWVLGNIKDTLGGKDLPPLSLNIAAPMGHLEDTALKERYLHVVQAAWEATFGSCPVPVNQGVQLDDLRPRFQKLLDRSIPDRAVRPFEILPETLAPLVSLSQDPQTRPGFYLMVDMGAGTTELSVSHVNEQDADHRILCYADTSILLGGDQFNEAEQKQLAGKQDHTQEEELKTEFLHEFRKLWGKGFNKDKTTPAARKRWKQLKVVLSGGGLRRKCLEDAIKENPPLNRIFMCEKTDYEVGWHRPNDLEFYQNRPESRSVNPPDILAYLAVAHGLSLVRQKWPDISFPKNVAVLSPDIKGEDSLDDSHMGW